MNDVSSGYLSGTVIAKFQEVKLADLINTYMHTDTYTHARTHTHTYTHTHTHILLTNLARI